MIAYARRNRVDLYVILSVAHIPWISRQQELHYNYSIIFYGEDYDSKFRPKVTKPFQIVLRYNIPLIYTTYRENVPFINAFNVSLRNNKQNRLIEDITVCVRPTPPSNVTSTVCSIITDPVSPYQLRHWLSYYFLIGIDRAVIYSVAPLAPYQKLLSTLKNPGRVDLVEWNFNSKRGKDKTAVQYDHREAQVTSCFYRNKYSSRFVLVADIDQYFYATKKKQVKTIIPFIRHWLKDYPTANVYNIPWNYFMPRRPVKSTRQQLLLYQNATLFNAFREVEHESVSSVLHPIINRNFNGILDPAGCSFCEIVSPVNSTIRMAYFRNKQVEQPIERNQILVHYAQSVRELQSELLSVPDTLSLPSTTTSKPSTPSTTTSKPSKPGTSSTLSTSSTSNALSTPSTPSTPSTTNTPGKPDKPGTSSTSSTLNPLSKPSTLNTSNTPNTPSTPSTSNPPSKPSTPSTPNTPKVPSAAPRSSPKTPSRGPLHTPFNSSLLHCLVCSHKHLIEQIARHATALSAAGR